MDSSTPSVEKTLSRSQKKKENIRGQRAGATLYLNSDTCKSLTDSLIPSEMTN